MTPSTTTNQQDPYEGRGQHVALGFAVGGGVIAWALHLNIMYFLVQPVCRLGGNWTFHVTSVLLLVVSLAAGWYAWRVWSRERTGGSAPEELDGRGPVLSFLGMFGMAASAVTSLAIVAQWVPVFVIGPCT